LTPGKAIDQYTAQVRL